MIPTVAENVAKNNILNVATRLTRGLLEKVSVRRKDHIQETASGQSLGWMRSLSFVEIIHIEPVDR